MKYLTGSTNDNDEGALIEAGIGLIVQPGSGYANRVLRYRYWAADNGCFADRWVEDRWINWLGRLPREGCLFVVSPDVYPDAKESLRRGLEFAPIIREMGFPVAIVAQDGAEHLPWTWDDIDCVFLGGQRRKRPSEEWKLSAGAWDLTSRARGAGKWVHMGRVNSLHRLEIARAMGCHSADGTFLKHRRRQCATDAPGQRDLRGATELRGWHEWLTANPTLPLHRESPSLGIHKMATE